MKEEHLQDSDSGLSADGNMSAVRPERKWRRILRRLALFFIVFLTAFTLFDIFVWKGAGVRSVQYWHGRRELSIHDVKYELSKDRTEIVMTCELTTLGYDKWPPLYFTQIRRSIPDWDIGIPTDRLNYSVGTPDQSWIRYEKREKRIPLASIQDSIVDALVKVEAADSAQYPGSRYENGLVRQPRNGILHPSEQVYSQMPFFDRNFDFESDPPIRPGEASEEVLIRELPDGLTYSMTVRQRHLKLLEEGFICDLGKDWTRRNMYPYRLALLPYDRETKFSGGETARFILIPQDETNIDLFFGEIREKIKAAEQEKPGFSTAFQRIVWLPAGALLDVFLPVCWGFSFLRYMLFDFGLPNPH
jgi:hypothetical protein